MNFPSIKSVANDIKLDHEYIHRSFSAKELNDEEGNSGVDIRLQVVEDGRWSIHTGDSSYDLDHNGSWGYGFLPYGRINCRELAKELLDEAKNC